MENKTYDSVAVCALIKSYFYDPSPEELAESCISKAQPGDRYFGLTKEGLLNKWNERKCEGIALHKSIETDFKNSCLRDYINLYLSQGYEKHDEMNLSLLTKKYLIKGRADCVFINNTTKKIIICEWKNCHYYSLKSDNMGFGPCEKLYNTKFTKHILQGEFYKRILESNYSDYDIKVEIIYIYDNKIEKIIKPYETITKVIENIINDLNN